MSQLVERLTADQAAHCRSSDSLPIKRPTADQATYQIAAAHLPASMLRIGDGVEIEDLVEMV